MKQILKRTLVFAAIAFLCATGVQATDWWAYEVMDFSCLGNSPYDDPTAVLGKPTVWMNNSGVPGNTDPCAVMMVCGAWNVGWPNGEKLVTTIKAQTATLPAGHITVRFATPIFDDPFNWYGKDFLIFGNGAFATSGSYVYSDSNMEETTISQASGDDEWSEPSPVSVSQDGVTWYSYTNGPYADDYAPTHALAWDWVENRWLKSSLGVEVELDFTKPVDPSVLKTDYDGKTAARGIDMYGGSGGGTAFDLDQLPLPIDPATGRKWIQYVRVEGAMGEVDAFSRVSRQIGEMSIGVAKSLPDGSRVVLRECVVSAATYEVGRYCYVEHPDRSGGIRVIGRVLDRDKHYIICGDMDTIGDERVVLATAVTPINDVTGEPIVDAVLPLGMIVRSIGGQGLSATALLVRTWGRVKSVDPADKSFVIDDGSGLEIRCLAPRMTPSEFDSPNPGLAEWGTAVRADFNPPPQNHFVIVTGISSLERNAQDEITPVIRLRDQNSVVD